MWEERYLGRTTIRTTLATRRARAPDLYVLTGDDVPFVQDGLRDGEHLRTWMTERFRQRLEGRSWIEVRGPHEDRMREAVAAIDGLLRWDFAPPLLPRVP